MGKFNNVLVVFGVIAVCLSIFFITYGLLYKTDSIRPDYCINKTCVRGDLFINLPKYPSNLKEVSIALETNSFDLPENFSIYYPDENYYKQPEFLPDESFIGQGLRYYTTTPVKFSVGAGCYPSTYIISNKMNESLIHVNDTIPIITYCHTGFAVWKYQLFRLSPSYPDSMSVALGTYKITQNPDEASKCFDVKVVPDNIILTPTYPIFTYNWSQKVVAYVTVKCKGTYGMEILPIEVSKEFFANAVRSYGLYNISDTSTGNSLQVIFEVY